MAVSPPSSALSIAFVDAPAGVLDAGAVRWTPRKGTAVTMRTFAIRIGQPSREARGTATLRAFLETADPRSTIRIDGIALSTTPKVIRRHAPIGIPTTHKLEIEVPASVPEGTIAASIGWEVTTD
ncbi:MAG: hypothetical protein ACLGH0_11880 [Thermoanaerobaculia bacterium]